MESDSTTGESSVPWVSDTVEAGADKERLSGVSGRLRLRFIVVVYRVLRNSLLRVGVEVEYVQVSF